MMAIEKAGYRPGENVSIALDVASTEFYDNKIYTLNGENEIEFPKSNPLYPFKYPIISIEDGISRG